MHLSREICIQPVKRLIDFCKLMRRLTTIVILFTAIFLFAVFKNRVASLSLQAITMADEFLLRVNATARAKPAATSQAPQA